jgi:hypothetical protein
MAKYRINTDNRPLVTADGFIDRGALLALFDEIVENARIRGARVSEDDAWAMAWAAAHELWTQTYKERATA